MEVEKRWKCPKYDWYNLGMLPKKIMIPMMMM